MIAPGEPWDPSLRSLALGVFADWSPPSAAAIEWVGTVWGASDIVFGLWSDSDRRFAPRAWSLAALQEVVECALDFNISPHLMFWAKRHSLALPAALDWAVEAVDRCPGLESVLLDCEGHWHRGRGITADEAAGLVVERLDGIRFGVTGLPRLHSTVRPVAERADYVVPQCYSFWKPGEHHWSHNRGTAPLAMQAAGAALWKLQRPETIMGLACYWGARPGKGRYVPALTASQTMRASAIETVALGIDRAWYWSLKWLRARTPRGEEVRRFFGVAL